MVVNIDGLAWFCSLLLAAGSVGAAYGSDAAHSPKSTETAVLAIDPELLEVTHDPQTGLRSMGVREQERDAYYKILEIARETDDQAQKSAARLFQQRRRTEADAPHLRRDSAAEFPAFVDLFRNPELYHGKPVTLRGHVRLWQTMPAGENDYGIETLYEFWLYTEDSQGHPAVVVCTSIPEGLPQVPGDVEVLDNVSATGYFFKMYGYQAQDLPRFAPMLLAQRIAWTPLPARPPLIPPEYVAAGVVLAMALFVLILWQIGRRDRRFQRMHRQPDAEAPDFSNL